jgi:hypothetical protein
MKTNKNRLPFIALLCSCLCIFISCSRDNDIDIPEASVNSLNVTSVTVGDELKITGDNIHLITKVTFGGVETPVDPDLGKRDRNNLTVTVPTLEKTQSVPVIATYNTSKIIVISENLEVVVPPLVPVVASEVPAVVTAGEIISVTGNNLHIVKMVRVGNLEVNVRSKDERSLTFVVPSFNEETSVTIKLIYDNVTGENQELVLKENVTVKISSNN